jgi:hypothetical protein
MARALSSAVMADALRANGLSAALANGQLAASLMNR